MKGVTRAILSGAVALLGCGRTLPAALPSAPAPALVGRAEARVEVASQEPGPPPSPALELAPPAPAPTWSSIYARYLGPGTPGGCGRSGACHGEAMPDASSAYEWLASRGYIDGARSTLVRGNSCLRWFGGNMPPRATPSESAAADLSAWVAAGARND